MLPPPLAPSKLPAGATTGAGFAGAASRPPYQNASFVLQTGAVLHGSSVALLPTFPRIAAYPMLVDGI